MKNEKINHDSPLIKITTDQCLVSLEMNEQFLCFLSI